MTTSSADGSAFDATVVTEPGPDPVPQPEPDDAEEDDDGMDEQ